MDKDPFKVLQTVKADLFLCKITRVQAEERLKQRLYKEELAEFIVDAIERGWISNFNMGLNEDGHAI